MEEKRTTEGKATKAPVMRGVVTSAAVVSTVTVEVKTLKTHPKYGKQYRSSKKYLVHVPTGKYEVGDPVSFRECRPMSARKRHIVVS
jgi:small subunit ribosomal protein S17